MDITESIQALAHDKYKKWEGMQLDQLLIHTVVIVLLLAGMGLTALGLPGNLLIFVTALAYGYYDGFVHIGYTFLFNLLGILLLGELVEFIAGAYGAKRERASKRATVAAVFGAILGGIVGTGLLPVIGSLLGAMCGSFIVSFVAEYTKTGDMEKSQRVAKSVMTGQMIGMIVKFAIGIGMLVAVISQMPWDLW
jgi:uncharacterized protein YqgC (DUF456 family)